MRGDSIEGSALGFHAAVARQHGAPRPDDLRQAVVRFPHGRVAQELRDRSQRGRGPRVEEGGAGGRMAVALLAFDQHAVDHEEVAQDADPALRGLAVPRSAGVPTAFQTRVRESEGLRPHAGGASRAAFPGRSSRHLVERVPVELMLHQRRAAARPQAHPRAVRSCTPPRWRHSRCRMPPSRGFGWTASAWRAWFFCPPNDRRARRLRSPGAHVIEYAVCDREAGHQCDVTLRNVLRLYSAAKMHHDTRWTFRSGHQ